MKLTNLLTIILINITYVFSQDSRIINGFPVEPEFKYPWMVSIFRYGEYWCGGTLLRDDIVITAAHCAGGLIAPLNTFEIQLHRHNISKPIEEEKGKAFKVVNRWTPKDYKPDTKYNDISLLQFNNTSKKRTSVVIDKKLDHKVGMRVTALGWGSTKLLGENTDVLQEVWLPLASPKKCANVYKQQLNYSVLRTQICAGFDQGGKDTCRGDSGGPLFSYVNDKPVLIGITSNGISCAKANTPAVYTRVAKFNKWINDILAGKIKPTPVPKD